MQYQAMAEAGLLSSSTKLTNTKLQSILATQFESDAKAEEVMTSMGLTVAKEGEDAVTVKLTAKKLQEAVASGVLTEAQAQELAMTLGVTTATNAQAASVIPAWIAKMKAMTAAVWAQVKASVDNAPVTVPSPSEEISVVPILDSNHRTFLKIVETLLKIEACVSPLFSNDGAVESPVVESLDVNFTVFW